MPAVPAPPRPSPPRPEPPWLDAALRAAAAVVAAEPPGAVVLADYARLFQLTPAEAELLPALAGPQSLAALAREGRLARSTLRGRVQALARKVGLHGVGALRRELRGLPPLRA
jgi:hypothetical protein